jgi:predicted RNA-binding Zn-ribbon protein involved in translation (DUF1610 family)
MEKIMIVRKLQFKQNAVISPCPECGNNTVFILKSCQCAEDLCETFVECECGYEPTAYQPGNRYENVWGDIDATAAHMAMECWNDSIAPTT